MAKSCVYRSVDELPNTLNMKHIESALGVWRGAAYRHVEPVETAAPKVTEDGKRILVIPAFQSGEGCKIQINKDAFLRAIGYKPLKLTTELAQTPLVWNVEDVAKYHGCHEHTAYEMIRRVAAKGVVFYIGKRIKVCREAWLLFTGYQPPITTDLQATA